MPNTVLPVSTRQNTNVIFEGLKTHSTFKGFHLSKSENLDSKKRILEANTQKCGTFGSDGQNRLQNCALFCLRSRLLYQISTTLKMVCVRKLIEDRELRYVVGLRDLLKIAVQSFRVTADVNDISELLAYGPC